MSPSDEITTIEMSPNLEVSTGGRIGKDSDELQGVTTGRDIGKSRRRRTETGRCRSADGDELSAEQALGQALSRRGNGGAETRERGAEGACVRVGADGWKFPQLAGGARAAWLLDEHGGRCLRKYAGAHG